MTANKLSKIYSATTLGLSTPLIEVELDITRSIPKFTIVGLGDTAVQESRERVMSAIKNSGFEFPRGKVTVNLAPADIRKQGPFFDLPICMALLQSQKDITKDLSSALFIGEVALDGSLRHVNGALSITIAAREAGFQELYLPLSNIQEATLIDGIDIYGIENIKQLVQHLNGVSPLDPHPKQDPYQFDMQSNISVDFSDIKWHTAAKRALEIAAAWDHNLIMSGPPGSGKTMLAKWYQGILPPLEESEIIESTRIHSIAGLLQHEPVIQSRPFRHPHHSSSLVSLVGGWSFPKPGEISLSHRWVLFLDEFPEFDRWALEALRQPLEDHEVTISRAQGSVNFPAKFSLIAAMNPCPCGFLGDPEKSCDCSPHQIIRYRNKISGPILDRIDLHIEIPRISYEDLNNNSIRESSEQIQKRVLLSRDIQKQRFTGSKTLTNSEMNAKEIEQHCRLSPSAQEIIKQATKKLNLSGRGYHRLLKLSRTIADLDQSQHIDKQHLMEALQYRKKEY